MKLFLLVNFICAYEDGLGYLCDRCDLYDVTTHTILDKLGAPGWEFRGPRPIANNTKPPISINVSCHDDTFTDNEEQNYFSDHVTLMYVSVLLIVGLLNLVLTFAVLITERKVTSSARKTYMQTAILENE